MGDVDAGTEERARIVALGAWMDAQERAARAALDKFRESFEASPGHALRWRGDAVAAVAILGALARVRRWLAQDGATIATVREEAERLVVGYAGRLRPDDEECVFDTRAWAAVAEAARETQRYGTP